jgi:hypothetical protein
MHASVRNGLRLCLCGVLSYSFNHTFLAVPLFRCRYGRLLRIQAVCVELAVAAIA